MKYFFIVVRACQRISNAEKPRLSAERKTESVSKNCNLILEFACFSEIGYPPPGVVDY